MPIAWHPKRWWRFCVLEDEEKEIELVFNPIQDGLFRGFSWIGGGDRKVHPP